ncbi:TIGR04222 domain-containing membrane protein [Pseudonocardiaceae bacterium YIM PH 21723]|nr:TIGR04222 domain-containing membrane protein [Pseudonocardiaceae bacterium YIM PH 21723]
MSISGAEFVGYFGAALAFALLTVLLTRWWARSGTLDEAQPELTAYQVALVTGGPDRVVDTAIAGLLNTGGLHFGRDGRLLPTDSARPDELQRAVLRVVGPGNTEPMVRLLMHGNPGLVELQESVIRRGLLARPGRAAAHTWSIRLFPLLGLAGLMGLFGGVVSGRSTLLMMVELGVLLLLWQVAHRMDLGASQPTRAAGQVAGVARESSASSVLVAVAALAGTGIPTAQMGYPSTCTPSSFPGWGKMAE